LTDIVPGVSGQLKIGSLTSWLGASSWSDGTVVPKKPLLNCCAN